MFFSLKICELFLIGCGDGLVACFAQRGSNRAPFSSKFFSSLFYPPVIFLVLFL